MEKRKFIFLLFLLLWCFCIFSFSNHTSSLSNQKSRQVLTFFVSHTVLVTNKMHITSFTSDDVSGLVLKFHYPFRKLCHFMIYFVLSILCFSCFFYFGFSFWKCFFLSILFCFLYSISDEIHQLFILGRDGQLFDCLIDTLGAFFGTFFISYFFQNRFGSIKVVR